MGLKPAKHLGRDSAGSLKLKLGGLKRDYAFYNQQFQKFEPLDQRRIEANLETKSEEIGKNLANILTECEAHHQSPHPNTVNWLSEGWDWYQKLYLDLSDWKTQFPQEAKILARELYNELYAKLREAVTAEDVRNEQADEALDAMAKAGHAVEREWYEIVEGVNTLRGLLRQYEDFKLEPVSGEE